MPVTAPANPADVIDLTAYDGLIEDLETAFVGTGTAAAAGGGATVAGGGLLIISAGLLLDYDLLNNKHWNNFWTGVGARLSDVFSRAGSFLFGGSGPTIDEIRLAINYGLHLNMRATRQLVSNTAGRLISAQGATVGAIRNVARVVNNNWIHAQSLVNGAKVFALTLTHSAEVRAIQREAALQMRMTHYVQSAIANEARALTHAIVTPLQHEIVTLRGQVHDLTREAAALKLQINGSIVPKVTLAVATATAAAKIAQKTATWVDDCGEPMCETQGPKTDWGKLFRRFGPTALWVLLSAVAASDPKEVERAAIGFADTFGSTLEHWANSYLGIISGSNAGDVTKVGSGVGEINITSL